MRRIPSGKGRTAALGVLLGASLALIVPCALHACTEYDTSLLRYSDAAVDTPLDDASPPDAPTDDGTGTDADADPAVDADASIETDATADVDGGTECSTTRVDCDGDEGNGCETDLTTEGENCGVCGHGCLGGACVGGACQPVVLASGQDAPSNVAVDSTHLYWTNQVPQGAVMRIPKGGGVPEVVGRFELAPGGLALDTTHVFWSEFSSNGTVWRLAKSDIGSTVVPLALATGQGTSTAVALDTSRVYWTTPSTVRRVLKSGGAVENVASGQETPGGLVAGLNWVAWTNITGGTVVGTEGGDAGIQVFASGQDYPAGLTADLGNLYWTNFLGGADGGTPKIMTIAMSGTSTPTVIAAQQSGPLGITQFGTDVFWTNNVGGTVVRAPKTGGVPTELASGQQAPAGIDVDANAVYWVNRDDGTVMAVAR